MNEYEIISLGLGIQLPCMIVENILDRVEGPSSRGIQL